MVQASRVCTASADVLIVDDHADVREAIRDLLLQAFAQLRIALAGDARQALALAHGQRFDVALIDIVLPDIGGLDLIRLMRPLLPDARFLVVSIHDGRAYRDGAQAAGAAGFVGKRHLHDDLLATFGSLLCMPLSMPGPAPGGLPT